MHCAHSFADTVSNIFALPIAKLKSRSTLAFLLSKLEILQSLKQVNPLLSTLNQRVKETGGAKV